MFHAAKFPSGSAHLQRRELLRQISDILEAVDGGSGERFFKGWDQLGKRGMYTVQYAGRVFGLEKSQTELVMLGVILGLLISRAPVSRVKLTELLDSLCVRLPDGQYPGQWVHEPEAELPEPAAAAVVRTPSQRKKT